MIWDGTDVIIVKHTINVMCLHHWKTTPLPHYSTSLPVHGKTIFPQTIPGAKKAGDHCCRASTFIPQGPAHVLLVTTCFYKIDPYCNFTTIYFHFIGYIHRIGISGYMVTLCLTFWGTANFFSKLCSFIVPPEMYVSCNFWSTFYFWSMVLIIAILVGVKECLIVWFLSSFL